MRSILRQIFKVTARILTDKGPSKGRKIITGEKVYDFKLFTFFKKNP